ncbi:MAG: 16S rRNA processing protein RimM [Deltaproteobacteria bacterium]|nr:16S rRNA processing protein RimM [Deltaproteobacteria bacterium]
MMDVKLSDLLEVGVVIGVHGLRGDLKIRPLPTGALALPGARTVYLKDSQGLLAQHEAVRSTQHKQNILLRLSGLDNLYAVESLVGSSVWMTKTDLPELDDEQFYWSDLEGLEVIDQQQGVIGHVVGMFATSAHDILEVDGPAGEILIPAIEPFLVQLDRGKEQLHVNLPEGLIPEPGK